MTDCGLKNQLRPARADGMEHACKNVWDLCCCP